MAGGTGSCVTLNWSGTKYLTPELNHKSKSSNAAKSKTREQKNKNMKNMKNMK